MMRRHRFQQLAAAILLDRAGADHYVQQCWLAMVQDRGRARDRRIRWCLALKRDGIPQPPDEQTVMPRAYWDMLINPYPSFPAPHIEVTP